MSAGSRNRALLSSCACGRLSERLSFVWWLPGARAQFDIHSLEDLDRAARRLGCRELHERCAQRLGDFESRIRLHRWADVVRHNDAGGCWITMDG
eukprot:1069756-Prymnesium_polylepis.1